MTFGSNEALLGYMKTVSDVVAAHALKAQLAAVQSGRPYSGEKYAQFYADLTRDIDEARRVASPADAIRVALETFQRATEHVYQFNALRSEIDQSVAEVENSIRQLTVASADIASSEAFEQFVAEASATGLIKREQDRLLELSADVR